MAQKDGKEISRLLVSAESVEFTDFEQTIELTNQVEKLITQMGPAQFPQELIRCYQIRILACRYFQRLKLLRDYAAKNAEWIETLKVELGSSYLLAKIRSKISFAHYYYEIHDYTRSLTLLSESLTELKQLPQTPKLCEEESGVIQYIATIHNARGEFEAAINQFVASIPYEKCAAADRQSDFPTQVMLFRNIGRTYLNKRDLTKAREFLAKAMQLFTPYLNQNPSSAASTAITLFEAQAVYYRLLQQYDSALMVTEKALRLVKYSEPSRGRVYHNLGEANENLKRYGEAEKFYQQELSILTESSERKSIQKANAFLSYGSLCEKRGKVDDALRNYQNAIANLVVDFTPQALENPALNNILSKRLLFAALRSKYHAQLKQRDTSALRTAWQTCQLSLALLDSAANEYSLDRDKVILQEQGIHAFEDGLNMAHRLFSQTKREGYFDDCFALIERSKGKVLLENVRLVNQFAGINPALLEKEKEVKSELLIVEQGIFKGELAERESADLAVLREQYADLKRNYASLMADIKLRDPEYYRVRFDHRVIEPQKVQTELLQQGEVLVEFFVGDSALTTIAMSSTKRYVSQKKLTGDFFRRLTIYRELLTNAESDTKSLKAKSKEWFNFLLEDALINMGVPISSLVIVPDGVLGYIPFETFITPDDRYLAEKYSIRYAQSATYLQEQERKRAKNATSFLAGFVSSESLNTRSRAGEEGGKTLVGAKTEVSSIARMVSDDVTVFDPATKEDFLQEAAKFKVLHLAMHSMVNEQNPMLSIMAFSPSSDSIENTLTAIEIYGLQFNAELAVLSACNTGSGELHRGEGIMSFARAFSYAGVPSSVISLWEVPDKATSKLMVSFYEQLKEGKSKAEALQFAKTEFVKAFPSMVHPFYWSGFILSGSNQPLQFPTSKYWYWISTGIAILIIILLLRRKIPMLFSRG